MDNKKVQFDYVEVFCEKKVNNKDIEEKYDLTGVFKKALKLKPKQTTKDFRGEKARMQLIKFDDKNKVWEIQFLRLREHCPPGIADDEGEFEIVTLEDGQYVGEFCSALYDKENCILGIHRNRNSLTPSGIEEYLNKVIKTKDLVIKLKPIIRNVDVEAMLKDKIYRTVTFGISTGDLEDISKNTHIGGLLSGFKKYQGANLKVEISLGNVKRDKTLAPGLVQETVHELRKSKFTKNLEMKTKTTPVTKVEKIDLLIDRVKDIEDFGVDRNNPLTHDRIFPIFKRAYLERKSENNIY
ncbi:DUF6731 family protein [Wukongibacter sp. M2B1]|uniref:DUF6731 family protein n=1 Tax=Wukongibacter sp. M2B1 TaxID=3088895 RepID=UPI003D78DD88